jgi:hypothetical protein
MAGGQESAADPPDTWTECFVDPQRPQEIRFRGSDAMGEAWLVLAILWALLTAGLIAVLCLLFAAPALDALVAVRAIGDVWMCAHPRRLSA